MLLLHHRPTLALVSILVICFNMSSLFSTENPQHNNLWRIERLSDMEFIAWNKDIEGAWYDKPKCNYDHNDV